MNTIPDPSVLRRRRTIEAGSLAARIGGVLCVVLFLAGWIGMPNGLLDAPWVRLAASGGLAEMLISVVLAVINLRNPGGRHYERNSTLGVITDTVAIAGIVASIQSAGQTTWPLLSLAILTAALRKQLSGALLAWTVTSGILAVAVVLNGHQAMPPGDLSVAVLSHLLVAILSGTQASAYSRQVNELGVARRQLAHQAAHDPLTGLPNRGRLTEHVEGLAGRSVGVLVLDLNGFKAVNDTLGHAAGDEVLRIVGDRLRAALRDDDLAGRIGGDEFVVVLADATLAMASGLAARLRADVRGPMSLDGRPVTVGVSIGVAVGSDTSLEALCLEADAAMYLDKAAA